MTNETLLYNIYTRRIVETEDGVAIPLDSELSNEEGQFIQNIIKTNGCTQSIETGCAYGVSSLHITNALRQNGSDVHHTIIDPNQSRQWKNVGISNLKRVGFDAFTLIEKPSEIALPELLADHHKFNFGLIDGWHTFDHTLVDFFYMNRMLEVGGIIVIDDLPMPAINKVVRYINNYPCYELIGNVPIEYAPKRSVLMQTKRVVGKLAGLLPYNYHFFDQSILKDDYALDLNCSMVAFKKIKEDDRNWDWYMHF
jgi:predicted O-methyltransferase YrrM